MAAARIASSGLISGTLLMTLEIPHSFAFDKPLLTFSALIAASVLTAWVFQHVQLRFTSLCDGSPAQYIPLDPDEAERKFTHIERFNTWRKVMRRTRPWHIWAVVVVLRLEVLRHVVANTPCTTSTLEPLLPVVLVCLQRWSTRRVRSLAGSYDGQQSSAEVLSFKHIVTSALFALTAYAAVALTRGPRSTFICAATLHNRWFIPVLQAAGTALDAGLLLNLPFRQHGGGRHNTSKAAESPSFVLIMSTVTYLWLSWSAILCIYYAIAAAKPQERRRMLNMPSYYMWSLTKLTALTCMTLFGALVSIAADGVLYTSIVCTFVAVYTASTSSEWYRSVAFPPIPSTLGLAAAVSLITALALYSVLCQRAPETAKRTTSAAWESNMQAWRRCWALAGLVWACLCSLRLLIWMGQSKHHVTYHPIDLFMYDAASTHQSYAQQASASHTLEQAVANYLTRHKKHPPPNFDAWYRYASERHSMIVDDFDSIHRDLLPYFALSPKEIRDRTQRLLQTPWHNATGITIRDGKSAISTHVNDDHRWMMNGLVEMIGKFSEWLPDMEIAFNIHDECRIAAPWEELHTMRSPAPLDTNVVPRNQYSRNRAEQWQTVSTEQSSEIVMTDLSWEPIFHSHGNAHCPANSAARTQRHWDRGQLCTDCAAPHSIGNFLANWTDASDICNQPDMADLHGFYMAPSAFKTTHQLLPLFSQSKAPGFSDIVYPSVWNWLDKAKYAPNDEYPDVPYANKNGTLFWRGVTSEGMSPDRGQWEGMSRQRFLHVLNNINLNGATQAVPIQYDVEVPPDPIKHLPATTRQRYVYKKVPISTFTSLIPTDVHFVHKFLRCWDIDCPHQAAEFGLAEPTDFQAHWQYKYLLDLDGAGFSGRFLPFMHSHSLPFKAALFREWWDDRLTAWKHFVPLDLRAHGVWATLAYFTGLEGQVDGHRVKLEPHLHQGELIAEAGRKWAQKVLRKEDMEIYFFRLLLEWGRLTDDLRDEIGFTVSASA